MATVQTDGVSATSKSTTRNNRGAAINVGSQSSLLVNNQLGVKDRTVFGSTVVDNDAVDPVLVDGTFAYNDQKPVAMRLTSVLAGTVANTFLRSGASDLKSRRSIHRQEVVTTTRYSTAFRAGYFNIYTGSWTTTPTTVDDAFWSISAGATSSTSTDNAATPTRSVPGDLTFKLGGTSPVTSSYSPKNT